MPSYGRTEIQLDWIGFIIDGLNIDVREILDGLELDWMLMLERFGL